MNMKRSLDLYRFRTLAVFWARSATAAMTFASIAFGLILAVGTAFAAVDGFDAKGLPFAHEGFGVRTDLDITPFVRFGEENEIVLVGNGNPTQTGTVESVRLTARPAPEKQENAK